MGKCINHPDRETSYKCMKHNIYMCEECLKCRDPELFCKFRQSCPIWFLSKAAKSVEEPAGEKKEACLWSMKCVRLSCPMIICI